MHLLFLSVPFLNFSFDDFQDVFFLLQCHQSSESFCGLEGDGRMRSLDRYLSGEGCHGDNLLVVGR